MTTADERVELRNGGRFVTILYNICEVLNFIFNIAVYITGIYNRHFVCFPRFDITYSDMLTILNAIEYSIIIHAILNQFFFYFAKIGVPGLSVSHCSDSVLRGPRSADSSSVLQIG